MLACGCCIGPSRTFFWGMRLSGWILRSGRAPSCCIRFQFDHWYLRSRVISLRCRLCDTLSGWSMRKEEVYDGCIEIFWLFCHFEQVALTQIILWMGIKSYQNIDNAMKSSENHRKMIKKLWLTFFIHLVEILLYNIVHVSFFFS